MVAFVLAAISVVGAFQHVFLIVQVVVPALAGISILRKRIWGAYGFALFTVAQVAITPILALRAPAVSGVQIAASGAIDAALAVLFYLAGRSLAAAGAKRGWLWPWIAAACLFTVPLFFVEAFVMPSGSMENTLLIGDRMFVRVIPRGSPARGSIIVFHYPIDPHQIYIKRVIGLPGDRIRIVSQVVYRNGAALAEPYVVHKFSSAADAYRDNLPGNLSDITVLPDLGALAAARDMLQNHVVNGEVVVPPRKYFVLGDNRDASLDSRYWGFVDASEVIGKPILIYDSQVQDEGESGGANTSLRHRTRWERIFKVL